MIKFCEPEKLEKIIINLVKRIIKCIVGPQLHIAERASTFFDNEYFISGLKTYKSNIIPLIASLHISNPDTA